MAILKAFWTFLKLILAGIGFDMAIEQASMEHGVESASLKVYVNERGYHRDDFQSKLVEVDSDGFEYRIP